MFFIVELTIKQGERAQLLKYLNNYAIEVRTEDGCECLDILVDPQSSKTVILYEIWRDVASQPAHLETARFAKWTRRKYGRNLVVADHAGYLFCKICSG